MKIRLWDEVSDGAFIFSDVIYAEAFEDWLLFQTQSGKTVKVYDITLYGHSLARDEEIEEKIRNPLKTENLAIAKKIVNLLHVYDNATICGRTEFLHEQEYISEESAKL